MLYPAMRSSRFYLTKLDYLRTLPDQHKLVSVIGGLAFLHAISDRTRALCLVDIDPEPVKYCESILALIERYEYMSHFREYLMHRFAGQNVHMEGHTLEPDHFNWEFGRGNLASQEHYSALRTNLKRLQSIAWIGQCSLETFNYSSEYPVYVLASNCDSPLFTTGHPIIHRILDTATSRTRYLSWLWDVEFNPNPDNNAYLSYKDL